MWYLLPTGAGTSWAARHVSGRILTRTGHVSCAGFCDHEVTVLACHDASQAPLEFRWTRDPETESASQSFHGLPPPTSAAVYFRPAAVLSCIEIDPFLY